MIFSLAEQVICAGFAAMKLRAPAKVNLQLRVHGRRADGFHEIETLMVPISLADEIMVEVSAGSAVRISCDDPNIPVGDENLAARAAREYSRRTGLQFGAQIGIRKRIPMGAGLAGGSSDAAAVLVGLDNILETHLGVEGLEKVAAKVGSDVPFFIRGLPAMCSGRGEIIQPFDVPEKLGLLLLKPPFSVETPWAYKSWAASHSLPGAPEDEQDLGWIKIFNSLERPVFEKFLVLPVMKEWLRQQHDVRAAGMSGSGSTVFALLREDRGGADLEKRAKARFGDTLWTALCEAPSQREGRKARRAGSSEPAKIGAEDCYSNLTARAGAMRAARHAGRSAARRAAPMIQRGIVIRGSGG
jgi:4-diphosphocytidyl-2-C-methyl-D-erythritol kinase